MSQYPNRAKGKSASNSSRKRKANMSSNVPDPAVPATISCEGGSSLNKCKARICSLGILAAVLVSGAALSAQQDSLPGAPLRGLTAREFELFRLGRADFLEVESATDGLGPIFN